MVKQKGGRNGYYPDFNGTPCGGTLMYEGYSNHLTAPEWQTLQSMQKLDGVANLMVVNYVTLKQKNGLK